MECRVRADLVIVGEWVDPEVFTKLTSIEPTRTRKKGQVDRGPRTGQEFVRTSGLWAVELRGSNVEEVVVALLDYWVGLVARSLCEVSGYGERDY